MTSRLFFGPALVLLLAACSDNADAPGQAPETAEAAEQVLNLYSSRHYDTDLRLYEDFTAQTGIKINRIEAGADELIERIASEGEFSPADLLITVDAGRLWRAEQAGLFAPVDSELLTQRIPDHLRHPDGLWFGLSTRARAIVYNLAQGAPEGLENYEDLADPAHAGKVCIRSSGNIYNISLLASTVSRAGSEAAESWARGVVANFAREPQSNDTGQIRAVASGECGLAVANTYYLARLRASDNPEDNAVASAVGVIFPNQGGSGTHVNISGAGVVKNAPNAENAVKFLEYLSTDTAQEFFAKGNNEYPVVEGVTVDSVLDSFGTFKADDTNIAAFGPNLATAVQVMNRGGWK